VRSALTCAERVACPGDSSRCALKRNKRSVGSLPPELRPHTSSLSRPRVTTTVLFSTSRVVGECGTTRPQEQFTHVLLPWTHIARSPFVHLPSSNLTPGQHPATQSARARARRPRGQRYGRVRPPIQGAGPKEQAECRFFLFVFLYPISLASCPLPRESNQRQIHFLSPLDAGRAEAGRRWGNIWRTNMDLVRCATAEGRMWYMTRRNGAPQGEGRIAPFDIVFFCVTQLVSRTCHF